MIISTKEIFDSLREKEPKCTPYQFSNYRKNVENYILKQSGFHRETASKTSLEDVSRVALAFTKKIRKIWDIHKSTYDRAITDNYFSKELVINDITAASPQKQKPSSSTSVSANQSSANTSAKQPFRRRAKKDFSSKSDRAQRKQTAQVRTDFPAEAITKAAGQVLRQSGQGDSAHVMKRMLDDPTTAAKARKAIKLDDPCKFEFDSVANFR